MSNAQRRRSRRQTHRYLTFRYGVLSEQILISNFWRTYIDTIMDVSEQQRRDIKELMGIKG